jgi:hypothetical protein
MVFRVLIIGGTGQVGAAVVRALVAEPSCAEVVMVNRKTIPLTANYRLRQVILDTAAAQFPAEVTKLALSMVALGDPVYGSSCVGVGKGSMKWSEEELKAPARSWSRLNTTSFPSECQSLSRRCVNTDAYAAATGRRDGGFVETWRTRPGISKHLS